MHEITVHVDNPYNVTIGTNLFPQLIANLPKSASKIAIIHAPVMKNLALDLQSLIQHPSILIELPDAESAKTYAALEMCWDALGSAGFTRGDAVISLGGGATTDVAGFVAASWLRGIHVVHVPTTLLAMVDAAVGGKTGINTAAGKNLVGAFYHPHSVWCDISVLKTVPYEDLRAGFGEIIKCGFIADPSILIDIENAGADVVSPEHALLPSLIQRAISVKAQVVAADFTESQVGGLGREILNYGHTFGHAIEKCENYAWRHGDAISVGMIFVAELAVNAGVMNRELADRHRAVLDQVGLPTRYVGDFSELRAAMAIDKKSRGSQLRFIGLADLAQPVVLASPEEQWLADAYSVVSQEV